MYPRHGYTSCLQSCPTWLQLKEHHQHQSDQRKSWQTWEPQSEAQSDLQWVAQLKCPHLTQPGWACWKQERAPKAEQSGGSTAQNSVPFRTHDEERAWRISLSAQFPSAGPVLQLQYGEGYQQRQSQMAIYVQCNSRGRAGKSTFPCPGHSSGCPLTLLHPPQDSQPHFGLHRPSLCRGKQRFSRYQGRNTES